MKFLPLAIFAIALLISSFPARAEVVIKEGDSIAFLGDSLTYLGNEQKPNGYVNLVIEGLKEAGVSAVPIPAGIGGNTTQDMLDRLDADVLEKKPVWMTLNSGINDTAKLSPEEFRTNLTQLVDRATAAGTKVILLTTTLGEGELPESPDGVKRGQFREDFRKLAAERKLILVELDKAMAKEFAARKVEGDNALILTYDGIHLNGLGNQVVAAEILRQLGVSDSQIATLRTKWNDYPTAMGRPVVSIRDYLKLQALAQKTGQTPDEQVSAILTNHVK